MSISSFCCAGSSDVEDRQLPSVRAKSRKNRVYLLRQFLLDTYGLDYLRRGVVLDVAGGKGDLSWLLWNMDQVDSIVVDPRMITDQHFHRSIEYLRSHPDEAIQRASPDCPTHQPLAALINHLPDKPQAPRHLRILVNQELVDAVANFRERKDYGEWIRYFVKASSIGAKAQPLLGYAGCKLRAEMCESDPDNPHQPTTIRNARLALELILKVKLIVGFHPDQAVDSCLDLSSVLNVPFCVVPCCVFPKEFPHRRLIRANGHCEHVRTYAQLVEYLQQKQKCERAYLHFFDSSSSRNVVLFTKPLL